MGLQQIKWGNKVDKMEAEVFLLDTFLDKFVVLFNAYKYTQGMFVHTHAHT